MNKILPSIATIGRTPIWLYVIGILPAVSVVIISGVQPWIPVDQLFRDTLSAASHVTDGRFPPYLGLVSNFGILLWSGATGVCFIGGLIVLRNEGLSQAAMFLFFAAFLSGALTVDDFFLAHERIYPRLFGIGEKSVFAGYGILTAAYLFFFRNVIWAVGPHLLLLSLACFLVSVLVDVVMPSGGKLHRLLEDGSKLLGITLWKTFHMWAVWLLTLKERPHPSKDVHDG